MVVKIVEILGISPVSFEDAIATGVARASKTVKHITGVDVVGQTAKVEDGKVTEYRVDMKLAFTVED
jgi:flavin-binding protein dodecin